MLRPKEDNVQTGKQRVGFENQNDVENLSLLNKAKELAPSLYNIDEMGKYLFSDYKIISEEELKCEAENGLVKEMKDDLKYATSLENEFDETCLILDIQQEFFKNQFESVKLESHSHVYETEIFKQNSSLENKNRCLKRTIIELLKQAADIKEEMTKRCAQYEKDFAKLEAHFISLKPNSPNKSSTSVQNDHVLTNKSDEVKIKFDTKDL
ncbi:hypothetical protein Tco_1244748 [Tanacetum coccineum]